MILKWINLLLVSLSFFILSSQLLFSDSKANSNKTLKKNTVVSYYYKIPDKYYKLKFPRPEYPPIKRFQLIRKGKQWISYYDCMNEKREYNPVVDIQNGYILFRPSNVCGAGIEDVLEVGLFLTDNREPILALNEISYDPNGLNVTVNIKFIKILNGQSIDVTNSVLPKNLLKYFTKKNTDMLILKKL